MRQVGGLGSVVQVHAAIAGLAPRYHNHALGELAVTRRDGKAWFEVGAFSSEVAIRPQPDGSLAFVTINPMAPGLAFIRADRDGMRKLVVRDGLHEDVFDESDQVGAGAGGSIEPNRSRRRAARAAAAGGTRLPQGRRHHPDVTARAGWTW